MKALYLLLLVSGTALADDAAILKCRSLADTGARLACYDALPVGAPAPASAGAAAAAPAAPVATPEQRFGMEQIKRKEQDQVKSIESTIVGKFEGWGPNTRIRLANGQVWRVSDGSSGDLGRTMLDPKVRIVRNLFGTMFLEIEGTNNSPKVRRVR